MKYIVSILFFFAVLPAGRAQQKAELRIGGGYGFSAGSEYTLDSPPYVGATHSVTHGFGQGTSINADATWWMNAVFGFTAGGSYDVATPEIKGHSDNYPTIDFSSSASYSWQSRTGFAVAGVAFRAPHVKLNPYARLGALLPVYSNLTETTDWQSSGIVIGGSNGTYQRTIRLRNTLGYTASAGIAPALNKHIAFFAEVTIQTLSILARRSTLTSYKLNGVEYIGNFTTSDKEIIYVKKGELNNQGTANDPSKRLTFSFPFSNIGIHAGVSIKL